MFDLKIIGQKKPIYDGTAQSVILDGVDSEYEFLSFHADTVGVLRKGDIIVNNKYRIPINGGVASFSVNKCLILVEER
ncbi:MAG: ATP synthase epsilon chain [Candidatus Omnitrophica bacterium]|nr:ATP synthase epsilon chain [Candidatus Omnitrophota bacterium]